MKQEVSASCFFKAYKFFHCKMLKLIIESSKPIVWLIVLMVFLVIKSYWKCYKRNNIIELFKKAGSFDFLLFFYNYLIIVLIQKTNLQHHLAQELYNPYCLMYRRLWQSINVYLLEKSF